MSTPICRLSVAPKVDASYPPKSMFVEYLKIAKTDLKAVCQISTEDLDKPQELLMTVHVKDINDAEVFQAVITMHISKRKKRKT